MSSTMASSFDKLERLFSKKFGASRDSPSTSRPDSPAYSSSSLFASRKGSLASTLASALPRGSAKPASLDDMHFPQPSFIRPSAAKMIPRDDFRVLMPGPRPLTAGRSMSVPDAHPAHPVCPPVSAAPAASAAPGSLRVVAPASLSSRGGATLARSPLGPPVSLSTSQARSMSVATARSTFDSRRSSFNTNNSSLTLSSGSSTISSCNSSGTSSDARHSYVESFPEFNPLRPSNRSSALLQRRDLSLAPLSSFDNFQIGQPQPNKLAKRDSVTITINSGEISPATILQATPVTSAAAADAANTVLPKDAQPEPTIIGENDQDGQDHLNDLHELPPLAVKVKDLKDLGNETPLLRRDSIYAPIALPQSRPASPAVSPRRRVRLSRRPMSLRYQRHLPNEPTPSSPNSVLMEPNLGDFLSLSDDDIAEDVPAKSVPDVQKPLPPSPPTSPTQRRVVNAPFMPPSLPPTFRAPSPSCLALLPGMPTSAGGRPRTPAGDSRMAAAFEIAHIASRYQFDLAYIATIWPKNMAYPKSSAAVWPSSPSSPPPAMKLVSRSNSQASRVSSRAGQASHKSQASFSSTASSTTGSFAPVAPHQSKLVAQFLAAFGLATVKTPYTLSAPMHARILNAEQQWTEFAGPDCKPQEFAQGFGCAFHRGHAPLMTTFSQQRYERRPSTAEDCDADTEQDYASSGRTTPRPTRRGSRKNSAASSLSAAHGNNKNNRGIVFVAYRRKEVADERAARGETDDLDALYRDIEALVQKIHDAHVQQSPAQTQAESHKAKPEVEDVLSASLGSIGASVCQRQSRCLAFQAS